MNYPEHDKLNLIKEKSQSIGEFLNWINEQGIHLCRMYDDYSLHYESTNSLLARFFEIDLVKLEEEKMAMLAKFRASPSAVIGEKKQSSILWMLLSSPCLQRIHIKNLPRIFIRKN